MNELAELRRAAREIFDAALAAVDARRAVLDAVELDGATLRVGDSRFELRGATPKVYSVATGKAAAAMASALDARLGEAFAGGVISSSPSDLKPSGRWRAYAGGHPLPNAESLEAARAAFGLLREADYAGAPVIFLVSGGGSAMLELPRDERLTLEELREANRVLVTCGAPIEEVNAVRRALSAVKGGGLAVRAPRVAQATLVVSDVAAGRAYDVASGPTLAAPPDAPGVADIVARHGLASRLPASVVRALEEAGTRSHVQPSPEAQRTFHVLLDNESACGAAVRAARARGFAVEYARDIVGQHVEEGAAELVSRLLALHAREGAAGARGVCLISGGEFSCPVRGGGTGGRNSETALRVAFEFDEKVLMAVGAGLVPKHSVALCAGTDGIDGNSPAAGALADETTVRRAQALGLDARKSLDESDAYSLFERLGDSADTGPTGTNVRDVRILLAV